MLLNPTLILPSKALQRPTSTRLVDTRYESVESNEAALVKMKEEQYAYMQVGNKWDHLSQINNSYSPSLTGNTGDLWLIGSDRTRV